MSQDQISGSRLVLVRHARPVIDPKIPPELWALEADAKDAVERLAEAIRHAGSDGVIVSPEPKARQTGEILAGRLQLPVTIDPAFREQGGGRVPYLSDDEFRGAVEEHFIHRNDVVFGTESSRQAAERFEAGIKRAQNTVGCPVVVTHGRVMCGYLASALDIDPVPLWRSLRLPDAVVVDLSARTFWRTGSPEEGRQG